VVEQRKNDFANFVVTNSSKKENKIMSVKNNLIALGYYSIPVVAGLTLVGWVGYNWMHKQLTHF
jgi:hypothetical protein